jgi:hypothetical protein
VVAVVADTPRRTLAQRQVVEAYQERAQALLRRALEAIPPGEPRAAFWRDVVQVDPALEAIRKWHQFSQLAGQFGRPAK